ncbi:hypothetical protein STXM2123_1871 [Streptomyces sp. F-3]|nr:hypothetical protein STXM2123_1871 [Streptomyces sp. F-3]
MRHCRSDRSNRSNRLTRDSIRNSTGNSTVDSRRPKSPDRR